MLKKSLLETSMNNKGHYYKLEYGEAGFNAVYKRTIRQAEKRNIDFNLSRDEFKLLTKKNCYYCGSAPSTVSLVNGSKHGTYIYNGVDRKNSEKSYFSDNVVSCCGRCNWMKRNLTEEQFKNHINSIHNYRMKNNE
jgi:hypothetical protein